MKLDILCILTTFHGFVMASIDICAGRSSDSCSTSYTSHSDPDEINLLQAALQLHEGRQDLDHKLSMPQSQSNKYQYSRKETGSAKAQIGYKHRKETSINQEETTHSVADDISTLQEGESKDQEELAQRVVADISIQDIMEIPLTNFLHQLRRDGTSNNVVEAHFAKAVQASKDRYSFAFKQAHELSGGTIDDRIVAGLMISQGMDAKHLSSNFPACLAQEIPKMDVDSMVQVQMDIYVLSTLLNRSSFASVHDSQLRSLSKAALLKAPIIQPTVPHIEIDLDDWTPDTIQKFLRPHVQAGQLLRPVVLTVKGLSEQLSNMNVWRFLQERQEYIMGKDQVNVMEYRSNHGVRQAEHYDWENGFTTMDALNHSLPTMNRFNIVVKWNTGGTYGFPIADSIYKMLNEAFYLGTNGTNPFFEVDPIEPMPHGVLFWSREESSSKPVHTHLHCGTDTTFGFNMMLKGRKEWNVTLPKYLPFFAPLHFFEFMNHANNTGGMNDVKDAVPEIWRFSIEPGQVLVFDDEWFHEVTNLGQEVAMLNYRAPKGNKYFPSLQSLFQRKVIEGFA